MNLQTFQVTQPRVMIGHQYEEKKASQMKGMKKGLMTHRLTYVLDYTLKTNLDFIDILLLNHYDAQRCPCWKIEQYNHCLTIVPPRAYMNS